MTAVLFDLFHTLIALTFREWEHESRFLKLTHEEWNRCVMDSEIYNRRALGEVSEPIEVIREIVRHAGKTVSLRTEQEMLRLRAARFREAIIQVRPEILATLRTLKERGHPLCLVSNADCIDILHWSESPLAPLFGEVIFSCDARLMKPDPEIYLLAARLVNRPPGACVFVGDGGSDELMGAKRVGMRTVQVRHFARREAEGADFRAERFEDVLDLIPLQV